MPKSLSTSRTSIVQASSSQKSARSAPAKPEPAPSELAQPEKVRPHAARRPRSRFEPEYELLLRRLVEARKAAGVTQMEIAKKLGKTQSHVSMCENREREISIIDLWKWCEAIGISFSEFVREFEDEVNQTHR